MPAIRFVPKHEQAILGSMLKDSTTRHRLVTQLTQRCFFAKAHKIIFAAIQELDANNLEYIPATLKTFLPEEDDEWGGMSYIEKLESCHAEDNVDYHIEQSRWATTKMDLLKHGVSKFEAILKDPRSTPLDAARVIDGYRDAVAGSISHNAIQEAPEAATRYKAALCGRSGGIGIRSTGYPAMDEKLVRNFSPGLITVIAAAPSVGKTTFALNMGLRQSRHWRVGYLAWESGNNNAIDILVSAYTKIPLATLVRTPEKIQGEDKKKLDDFLDRIFSNESNFSFMSRPPKDITHKSRVWEVNEAVLDWFEEQLSTWNREIVYWDLFEKCLPDRQPQSISWALDRAQEIAQKYGVHLALLHQLTFKEVEKLADKRPTRALLKGSGGYIEVPDFVFGLYRHAVYNPGFLDQDFEVHCLKQRNGPWPWRLVFDWDGPTCNITGGREKQIVVSNDDC